MAREPLVGVNTKPLKQRGKNQEGGKDKMVFDTKPILGAAVGLGSVALVGVAAKTAKDMWSLKPGSRSSKGYVKPLLTGFTALAVGVPLLKATSGMIK